MMCPRKVSVVMSVYNGERYVREAVDSILNQTFEDFEFIIIDDGSTDGTLTILQSYDDIRLRLVCQDNVGLGKSLNRGITLAQGQYIARIDHDDLSLPERFEKQVQFLDVHPDVGLLGTACRVIDELRGREWDAQVATSDQALRHALIKHNPFFHSSVMMRKSILEKVDGYDEAFPYIQDYELWIRIANCAKLANLAEVLTVHRFHRDSASADFRTEFLRLWLRMRIRYRAFRTLDYPPYYVLHVLHPLLLMPLEMRIKIGALLRDRLWTRTQL